MTEADTTRQQIQSEVSCYGPSEQADFCVSAVNASIKKGVPDVVLINCRMFTIVTAEDKVIKEYPSTIPQWSDVVN
uniref:Uncharacterized protein n=1 Tax=Amphimedon queenslandica TaxID=400682 RepID=A0A1X7UCG8_AMPQE